MEPKQLLIGDGMSETPIDPTPKQKPQFSEAAAFEAVVRARRSVRKFTDEEIPGELVQKCLDLALLAPNSSNLQAWEFYNVVSDELRKELNVAFLSQPAVQSATTLIVAVARTRTWKRSRKMMLDLFEQREGIPEGAVDYYKKLVPMVYDNGFLGWKGWLKRIAIFLVGLAKPVPREPVNEAELRTWAVKSTALACENLMLAFSAHGFDTCPMEGMDSKRVKKALGLPGDAVVVMGIAAGRRAEGGVYGPQIRFERDLFVKNI